MAREAFGRQLNQLKFTDPADHNRFVQDINVMLEDKQTKGLIHKNTIEPLKALYLTLTSERSPLELALLSQSANNQNDTHFIYNYFSTFKPTFNRLPVPHNFKVGAKLPNKPITAEVFIHLCERQLEKEYLTILIQKEILNFYQARRLQELKYFDRENFYVLVDFHLHGNAKLSKAQLCLGFDMLHLLYPTTLQEEQAAEQLIQFIEVIVPTFVKRFEHRMNEETLFQHPDRFAEWFMVWNRHLAKAEEEIEEDHEYYETDFATIVKYIPEFLWWNNGYYFRSGDKNFHFGSECFIHLAIGGSIRNAPDWHHYTRRMAKVFVNLPYYFEQEGMDMYLYCYAQSLGAGPLLSNSLLQFMRHPDNMTELQKELDQWHPIIQKLTGDIFENLDDPTATELLGYIYHCLRDQPGFSVQGRSVVLLLQDSDAYYQRIRQRAQVREELRRERERLRAAHLKQHYEIQAWPRHSKVKSYESGSYKIVELFNETMLRQEGNVMNHCVGSYTQRCMSQYCSIWSLRQLKNNQWKSCVTIELQKNGYIIQMRARFNATPSKEHKAVIERWVQREGIKYSDYV